jgi:lipoprotein NlpI
LFNLYNAQIPEALADITRAADLNPKELLNALWTDIVGQRSGLASRLPEAAAQLDTAKWPGPIVKLYLGQITPPEVFASIEEHSGPAKKHQTCQANFYSGNWALRQDKKEEAARLFNLAVNDCPKSALEWKATQDELKALAMALAPK